MIKCCSIISDIFEPYHEAVFRYIKDNKMSDIEAFQHLYRLLTFDMSGGRSAWAADTRLIIENHYPQYKKLMVLL
jgi:hypothetical protein